MNDESNQVSLVVLLLEYEWFGLEVEIVESFAFQQCLSLLKLGSRLLRLLRKVVGFIVIIWSFLSGRGWQVLLFAHA
jgi:hypothetical protein